MAKLTFYNVLGTESLLFGQHVHFLGRNVFGAECLCTGPKPLEICLYTYLLKFKLFCHFCKVKVWLIKSFATDIKLKKKKNICFTCCREYLIIIQSERRKLCSPFPVQTKIKHQRIVLEEKENSILKVFN